MIINREVNFNLFLQWNFMTVKWWAISTGVDVDKLYNTELKCCNRIHCDSYWNRMYIIHYLYKFLITHQMYISNLQKYAQEEQRILVSYLREKEKNMGLRKNTKWTSIKSVKFCLKSKTTWIITLKCLTSAKSGYWACMVSTEETSKPVENFPKTLFELKLMTVAGKQDL